jgi:hypothetical protein
MAPTGRRAGQQRRPLQFGHAALARQCREQVDAATAAPHRDGQLLALQLESGFRDLRLYWPIVGYQAPRSWVDLTDRRAMRSGVNEYPMGAVKRKLFASLASLGVLNYAVPHFGIATR